MSNYITEQQKAKKRKWGKDRRERLKAQGLCCVCGKQHPIDGKKTCQSCLEKRRSDNKYLSERHICPRCGKAPAVQGMSMCCDCLYRNAEYSIEYYRNNKDKAQTYAKNRYKSLKQEGICVKCGKRKAAPGRVSCKQCLGKERDKASVRRAANNNKPIDSCRRCNSPKVEGYCYCEEHLPIVQNTAREALKKANEARHARGEKHYWQRDNNLIFKNYYRRSSV